MKRIIYQMTVAVMLLVLSCKSASEKGHIETLDKFPIANPKLVDTIYHNEYVAEIQSVQNVEIRAQVKSYISAVHIDEGKSVKKGQLLFSLNSQLIKEELFKAQATLKTAIAETKIAELTIKNTQLLVEKNVVAKTELDMALANLEVLKAKVEEAKAAENAIKVQMTFSEIRAPFDGVIGRVPNKMGSLVDEGTLLTTISDNQNVFAYFNVSEKEYLNLSQNKNFINNQNILLILADGQTYPYRGRIETIDAQFDKTTGNIALRAKFGNPQQLLKHGASGKIQMQHILKNALVVPQKSTFDVQDKTYVYTIDNQQIVKMQPIVVKMRLPHIFVLESGLTVSDKIIYEGVQNVKEGDKIEILSMSPTFTDVGSR